MSFAERAAGNTAAFLLDGRRYRVELGTPALLDALATGALAAIVPGATDDPAGLWARLTDRTDPFDLADLDRLGVLVIEALTGWPAAAACALAHAADAEWPVVSGRATGQGLDLLAVPVRRVLAYVYALLVEGCDDEHPRERLDRELRDAPGIPGTLASAWRTARAGRAVRPRPAAPAVPAPPGEPAGFSTAEQSASFRAAASALGR